MSESTRTQILSSACVFVVKDVVVSAHFYRDKLGFHFHQLWGDPPSFCMAWRNESCVMLSQVADSGSIKQNRHVNGNIWDAYFWVDDIKKLDREFKTRGVTYSYEIVEKPYGVIELSIFDPDGYELCFGEELKD